MHAPASLPTAFETIAGVVKFIAVPRMSIEFYKAHQNAIDLTCTFLKTLASNYPTLEAAFRKSLPLPIAEGAAHIEAGLREAQLSEVRLQWLDTQTTVILRALAPVVQSQSLPNYLSESRWAVLGAFDGNAQNL